MVPHNLKAGAQICQSRRSFKKLLAHLLKSWIGKNKIVLLFFIFHRRGAEKENSLRLRVSAVKNKKPVFQPPSINSEDEPSYFSVTTKLPAANSFSALPFTGNRSKLG